MRTTISSQCALPFSRNSSRMLLSVMSGRFAQSATSMLMRCHTTLAVGMNSISFFAPSRSVTQ